MRVGKNLHLDMVCRCDELLHVTFAVAEGGFGFRLRLDERPTGVFGALDLADSAAAATGTRLDEHGAADAPRLRFRLFRRGNEIAAGNDGHTGFAGGAARGVLVAHAVDDLGCGAYEDQAVLLAAAREPSVLR